MFLIRYAKRFIEFNRSLKSRPTKYFLFIIAVFFGLFFQAYMHNYNIVYIVLFVVFALAGASCLVGRLNIMPIRAKAQQGGHLFAGRKNSLLFLLQNSARSDSYGLYVQDSYIGTLKAKSEKTVRIRQYCPRRGKLHIGTLLLQSFFPFGHIRFYTKLRLSSDYIVYPRPAGRPLKEEFARQLARFGLPEEFEDLKPYQPTDRLAHIHWPSVAKGEPMSKRFSYSREDIKLVFDYNRLQGDKESRLSQLCLWVLQARQARLAYELRLRKKSYYSTQEGHNAILETLALY